MEKNVLLGTYSNMFLLLDMNLDCQHSVGRAIYLVSLKVDFCIKWIDVFIIAVALLDYFPLFFLYDAYWARNYADKY